MLARASRVLGVSFSLAVLMSPATAPADQIFAWGSDGYGQVSGAPSGAGYTAIAAGHLHSLALAPGGSIAAWGADDYGQVSGTPSGTGFTAIDTRFLHGLALAADGSIAAWGWDDFGQVSGKPSGTGFIAIAAGGDTASHSLRTARSSHGETTPMARSAARRREPASASSPPGYGTAWH